MYNLPPGQQAAALHNPMVPVADRLALALQALDWYETDREKTMPVVEAAQAWRRIRYGSAPIAEYPKDFFSPLERAIIAAVDQMGSTWTPAGPDEHGELRARLVADARRIAGRVIAEEIRRELVCCCNVYERDHGTSRGGATHAICFWGEAAARIAEGRAS